jgi:hypothetical protein
VKSSTGKPWWLLGVACVFFLVGFYLEFTGKDGNSLPGAILVLVGFLILLAWNISALRHWWANRSH